MRPERLGSLPQAAQQGSGSTGIWGWRLGLLSPPSIVLPLDSWGQ